MWFVLSLFCFGWKVLGKIGQKCPIFVSSPTPLHLGEGVHA